MNPQTRQSMLKIIDGQETLVRFCYFLSQFKRCDQMLRFLINSRLIGATLVDWLKVNFEDSFLQASAFILKHVKKDNELKPVFTKDMIL